MNIKLTTNNYLCNSCGLCKSICPQKAIEMEETPSGMLIASVDEKKCNLCGKCINICQGYKFINLRNYSSINNIFQGTSLCEFVGKSNDESIYVNSQSGGIATSLGASLLEFNEVDGVLVTGMTSDISPRPYSIFANTKEKMLLSQKSKYCPTPLLENISQILTKHSKIAIIGLPCHIHALINLYEKNEYINQKIKYKIGLICDRVMTYTAIDYLINISGAKNNQNVSLNYRNKASYGFPGDVTIKNDKMSHVLAADKRMEIKDYFTPPRCLLCFDKMNIFSDITVGDPHGLKNYDRLYGESAVIVRSKAGLTLIKNCLKNNSITLRGISEHSIYHGQQIESHKKKVWTGYINAWKEAGLTIPETYDKIYSFDKDNTQKYKDQINHAINLAKCIDQKKLLNNAYHKFKNKDNISKKIKNIEIKGVGFVNKGAELMLESILQHYSDQKFNFVMEPISYNSTYQQRAKKGVFQKLSIEGNLIAGIPNELCKLYGLVSDDEIDAVLDASGFCYGDQWGYALSEEMARRIYRWKNKGKKVILLPQAFGPFTSQRIRTAMRSIVTNSDMIFARDRESYSHIKALNVPCDNVHISPDFTSITKGIVSDSFKEFSEKVCIIPNAMIYKKLSKELSDNYLELLKTIIKTAHLHDNDCFILIHEGKGDLEIGLQLQKEFKSKLSIVKEENPLVVKGIIGSCHAVASSRFHGIVSALSQAVPTICTGWSHKYKMLMEDYNCEELLIELDSENHIIENKSRQIIERNNNLKMRFKLEKLSLEQKNLVTNMWNKVDSVLLHH